VAGKRWRAPTTDVARKLGFPKSSTQGLLTTLAGRGYLAREGVAYFLPPVLAVDDHATQERHT
jgi:DNA-binding IclR family transcriptional regulator